VTEKLQIAKAFVNYFLSAKYPKKEDIPFLSTLYHEVIASKKNYYIFDEIEALRGVLLRNHQKITVKDLGAGSRVDKSKIRKISSITKNTVNDAKTGQMLFRLVNFLQPKHVVELGTSLGINTLYLAKAAKNSSVYTLEGCPNTLSLARENFKQLNSKNITAIEGNIDTELKTLLEKLPQIDLVFFDANHRKKPTIDYFKACLPLAKQKSVFIFDDIYWSLEMKEAWQEIVLHPQVTLSIDFFELGIIFFRNDLPKKQLILRF